MSDFEQSKKHHAEKRKYFTAITTPIMKKGMYGGTVKIYWDQILKNTTFLKN